MGVPPNHHFVNGNTKGSISMEVPTKKTGLCFRAMVQRMYLQNMAKNMVQYLHPVLPIDIILLIYGTNMNQQSTIICIMGFRKHDYLDYMDYQWDYYLDSPHIYVLYEGFHGHGGIPIVGWSSSWKIGKPNENMADDSG